MEGEISSHREQQLKEIRELEERISRLEARSALYLASSRFDEFERLHVEVVRQRLILEAVRKGCRGI